MVPGQMQLQRTPLRTKSKATALVRPTTAALVAHIAIYLASDESAFTTGQSFFVDGGFAL